MAVHPFLQPAVSAAVSTAVGVVKGAPTAPTTDELQTLLTQHAALLNQQSTVIQQQQATIAAFPQVLADAIALNNTQFVTPGLQAILGGSLPGSLDTLKELVQQMQADESGAAQLLASVNADRTRFAQLEPLVAGLGTNLTALTTTVGTKAAAADLTALVATVGTKAATADLAALTTTVAGKAASTDLAALQSTVSTNTADIATNTTALASKALASDVTALSGVVATKAAQADLASLTTTVAGKATSASVAALAGVVDGKASTSDLSALTTTVAGKALAADLVTTNNNVATNTTAINLRATTASVTALQATVTQNTTDIATKATTVALATQTGRVDGLVNTTVPALQASITQNTADIAARATTAALTTQTGRVDNLVNTTVPALQADTALRLLRTGDTATGQIKGPDAVVKTSYPTFQQTFGGVNSPRRTIQNLTTGTAAMVALTDTTGQNRTILPIGIQFLLTGSVGLLSSVTVKLGTTSGGAELYTKTYSVLTGLLGKVTTIDQPVSATPLPAGQILYATITGGGQWTCFFDAVFLPTAS